MLPKWTISRVLLRVWKKNRIWRQWERLLSLSARNKRPKSEENLRRQDHFGILHPQKEHWEEEEKFGTRDWYIEYSRLFIECNPSWTHQNRAWPHRDNSGLCEWGFFILAARNKGYEWLSCLRKRSLEAHFVACIVIEQYLLIRDHPSRSQY